EVRREHDGEARGQQHDGYCPESYGGRGHSADSLASPLAPAFASVLAGFGGACMSRSLFPGAHDGSKSSPIAWSRSLSSRRSRRSDVARSNDFIMMMASVGHTCTHSSQNSHA